MPPTFYVVFTGQERGRVAEYSMMSDVLKGGDMRRF